MGRIKGQLKLSWLQIPCAFRRDKGVWVKEDRRMESCFNYAAHLEYFY
jgi:hypothetical protein